MTTPLRDLVDPAAVRIRPGDIPTDRHFFDGFGNSETETSANWIVQFCTEANGDSWAPFTREALTEFYQAGRLPAINRKKRREYDTLLERYDSAVARKAKLDEVAQEAVKALDADPDNKELVDAMVTAFATRDRVFIPRFEPQEPAEVTEISETFCFNRLINPGMNYSIVSGNSPDGGGWLREIDGKLHVTKDFISRCASSTGTV